MAGFILLILAACNADNQQQATTEVEIQPVANTTEMNEMAEYNPRAAFAVIGDYGADSSAQANVASLVNTTFPGFLTSEDEDYFLVTVGDNHYAFGAHYNSNQELYAAYNASVCESDSGHGVFYRDFMPNAACPNSETIPAPPSRDEACTDYADNELSLKDINIYPVPGNEDDINGYNGYFRWARQACAMTGCNSDTEDWVHENYSWAGDFSCAKVPQNSYDVKRGDYHLFFLDTHWLTNSTCNATDHDGNTVSPEFCYSEAGYSSLNSNQKQLCAQGFWLEWAAGLSNYKYKLVIMHHSPFSSGNHGSCPAVQYNFREFGVASVFSGHTHLYERVTTTNMSSNDEYYYFITGSGGYTLDKQVCDSNFRVGEPHFTEETQDETLKVHSLIGYNRKIATESTPSGYGAMFVTEALTDVGVVLKPAFYDYRAQSADDIVDYCQLDAAIQDSGQSAPAKSVGCSGVNADYYKQCCDVETNAYIDCN